MQITERTELTLPLMFVNTGILAPIGAMRFYRYGHLLQSRWENLTMESLWRVCKTLTMRSRASRMSHPQMTTLNHDQPCLRELDDYLT